MDKTYPNLMASDVVVHLPEDPALAEIHESGKEGFLNVVQRHPESSLCWALLAEGCLRSEDLGSTVAGYAYARTGYHRGLDVLRRSGWKGSGQVPWDHEPNRGFLRALWSLAEAARRLGETDEAERCAQFLRDSSEQAFEVLSNSSATEPSPDTANPPE